MSRGILDGYYARETGRQVIFDTNRMWTARLPALNLLFPDARIIACVRNPAWVLDSIETLVRKNPLDAMRMFGTDGERISVFARADGLIDKNRLIGSALNALKEACFAKEARSMLLLNYDRFVAHPRDAMNLICQFLGEPRFAHDFENVTCQAETFDLQLLAKGLHDVTGRVGPRPRPTILPPDVFKRFAALEFCGKGNSLAHFISEAKKPE